MPKGVPSAGTSLSGVPMSGNGFVLIYRKIMESEVWHNPKLLKVWLWCLMEANWQDRIATITAGQGTKSVMVRRGQLLFGRFEAARALELPPSTVRNLVAKLVNIGNLDTNPDRHYTLLTVCNYNAYQDMQNDNGQPNGHEPDMNRTSTGHTEQVKPLKPLNKTASAASAAAPPALPPKPNPYWDAVVEVFGIQPIGTGKGRVGKLARDFKARCQAAGLEPGEIRVRRDWIRIYGRLEKMK